MKNDNNSISKNKEHLITLAGSMAEKYGLTRIAGELSALLLLSPQPMPIGEMSEILNVSKPSVSTNIRFLNRWGLAEKVPVRNDRRDFYKWSEDLFSAARAAFEQIFQRDARSLLDLMGRFSEEFSSEPLLAERLQEALGLFKALESLAAGLFSDTDTASIPIRDVPVE